MVGGAGDAKVLCNLIELLNAHVLQFDEIECWGAVLGDGLAAMLAALPLRAALIAAAVPLMVAALGAVGALLGALVFAILGCRRCGRGCFLSLLFGRLVVP